MDTINKEALNNKINDLIDQFKEDVDLYIKRVVHMQAFAPEELRETLAGMRKKLESAKNISVEDFDISKKTSGPNKNFSGGRLDYAYTELKEQEIDSQLVEAEKEKKIEHSYKATKRVLELKAKKGKIQKKQLKISEKLIVQKLTEYKKNKRIYFKQIDQFQKKYNNNYDNYKQQAEMEKLVKQKQDKIDSVDHSKTASIKSAKQDNKDIKSLSKKIAKLKKKNGKKTDSMEKTIAKQVKPTLIEKMQHKASEISRTLSDRYYQGKIAHLESKGL